MRDWDELRTYGPLPSMRSDPHPLPIGDHPEGVVYAATDLATALAEVFQGSRRIDVYSFAPYATAWSPTRPLRLLDITGSWALRNHVANLLAYAPRSICRAWACTIRATWPDVDGLWAPSTMTSNPIAVLWNPARYTFPVNPEFSRPLSSPTLLGVVKRVAAAEIGYAVAD